MGYELGVPFVAGGNGLGKGTATAGTVINVLVPPRLGCLLFVSKMVYLDGSTAHVITAMRPLGTTYLTANAAASQAVIAVASITPTQPNPNRAALSANATLTARAIAANDFLGIRQDDGSVIVVKVSSVSGKNVTLTANLATAITAPTGPTAVSGVAPNGKVWMFGIITDVDLVTGLAHPQYDMDASVRTSLFDDFGGVLAAHQPDDPILLQSNNVTAAGFFEQVSFFHRKAA